MQESRPLRKEVAEGFFDASNGVAVHFAKCMIRSLARNLFHYT